MKIQMHVMNKDSTNSAMCSREIRGGIARVILSSEERLFFCLFLLSSFFSWQKTITLYLLSSPLLGVQFSGVKYIYTVMQ